MRFELGSQVKLPLLTETTSALKLLELQVQAPRSRKKERGDPESESFQAPDEANLCVRPVLNQSKQELGFVLRALGVMEVWGLRV